MYLHLSVIFSVQVSHCKHQASALNYSIKDCENIFMCQELVVAHLAIS